MVFSSNLKIRDFGVLITLIILIILTSGCIDLEPTLEGLEILSDDDFEAFYFLGSGTIEDPYIISDYYLKQTSYGILVEGTSKHFVITNCTIERFYGGIHLSEILPGTGRIINNTIINAYSDSRYIDPGMRSGISIDSTGNIIIANNSIRNPRDIDSGISILYSADCLISQNRLSGHFSSIRLDGVKNITIVGNSFSPQVESFYCSDVSSITIQDNHCEGGIRLYDCENSTISNNTILNAFVNSYLVDSGHGIFASSTNCLFIDNRIQNNELYGIYLYSDYGFCRNNTLYHNVFLNNNLYGNQQADDGQNNLWYNVKLLQGNYWSDWSGTGAYPIDGTANSFDLYPLSSYSHTNIFLSYFMRFTRKRNSGVSLSSNTKSSCPVT